MKALLARGALRRVAAVGPMAVVEAASSWGASELSACAAGTIRLPPDGNPVILLADHQTTGGYAVPAVVARCDLWKVGQCGQRRACVCRDYVRCRGGRAAEDAEAGCGVRGAGRRRRRRGLGGGAGPNQVVDLFDV